MERALYHTYRPQRWEELIGQESVKLALQNQVEHGPLGHAFLFSGPRAVGKTSAARLLAKSANCTALDGAEPDNKCKPCVSITEGRALDVVEIDAASHTGVDHVREHIIQNARVAPSLLKFKVFIIDEVHMLSTSSFNALLKTLEEPPDHAIFVLATTELHKVPATIVSRCQHFNFKRIPVEPMEKLLTEITKKEKKSVEGGVLKRVAFASEGCVRDAQSLLAQVFSLGESVTNDQADLVLPRDLIAAHAGLAEHLLAKRTGDALRIISGLVEDNVHLPDFGKGFVQFLRNLLVFRATDNAATLTEARIDATVHRSLLESLRSYEVADLAKLNGLFLDAVDAMRHASVPTLPLEIAVVQWTGGAGAAVSIEPVTAEEDPKPPTEPPPSEPPASETSAPESPAEPTSEETPEPTPPPSAAGDSPVEFSKFGPKWEAILSELKKENPSLTATLKVGRPISIEQNVLTVAFRFPFHKEQVENTKNRPIVEAAIVTVVKSQLLIKCEVDPSLELNGNPPDADNIEPVSDEELSNVWQLAVNTFGEEDQ